MTKKHNIINSWKNVTSKLNHFSNNVKICTENQTLTKLLSNIENSHIPFNSPRHNPRI